jgi:hypothetical protein
MRTALLVLTGLIVVSGRADAQAPRVYKICRGEFEGPCKLHSYDRFERCGTYGVGGANPNLSCQFLCGTPIGPGCQASSNAPSISGNACGYAWFSITCTGGQ